MELSDSFYMTIYLHVTWYEMDKLSKNTVYFVHIDLFIGIGGGARVLSAPIYRPLLAPNYQQQQVK